MSRKTEEEHFLSCVSPEPNTGCWLWTGSTNDQGYGRFNYRYRTRRAHRASWELARGAIPAGMCVCHRCDNPPCVNPDHLFLGTLADNNKDCAEKGRSTMGEKHGSARLTEAQVLEFLRRVRAGESQRSVGRDFGLSSTASWDLASGKTWRHLHAAEVRQAVEQEREAIKCVILGGSFLREQAPAARFSRDVVRAIDSDAEKRDAIRARR